MEPSLILVAAALVAAVSGVSVAYHRAPFGPLPSVRPRLQWLPKYAFAVTDAAALEEQAPLLGFKPGRAPGEWRRGFVFGDWTASNVRLRLVIAPDGRSATLGAAGFGILADGGDLWRVAMRLRGAP